MNINITPVLQFLAGELDRFLKDSIRPSGYAGLADPIQLGTDMDYSDPNVKNRVSISFLGFLPDSGPASHHIYIMVFAPFKNYEMALNRISSAQVFFHQNPSLDFSAQAEAPAFSVLESVSFEPVFPDQSEIAAIWSVRGGKFFPSLFYKVAIRTK